jgi:cytochrome P450
MVDRKLASRFIKQTLFLLDTYTLPKGANVAIRIIDVQRNPKFWGNDASRFNPDRFLPENITKIHPFAYLPFSQGSRNCIGYKYASNAIKIVVTHILKNFKVTTPLTFDELKLEISFVLRISQNYIVKLEKR